MPKKRWIKIIASVMAAIVLFGCLTVASINSFICSSTTPNLLTVDEAVESGEFSCILVLGCGVRDDGTPSSMLEDRLKRGIELYKAGAAPKLLMSGDHGQESYNEVAVMKKYAMEHGVPSEDIFMDHAGFNTYDSIARARRVFEAKYILVVTQKYHLHRALYIARRMDIAAYGVDADLRTYGGQFARDVREVLARVKDFCLCLGKPNPTYLGDVIPVSGNGDDTNDAAFYS